MLKGKVALVTGASSGIGRATALEMAKARALVALVGRDKIALQKTAADIADAGGTSTVFPADLTHDGERQRVVEGTVGEFGGLDILVNAAGVIGSGTIENTSWEEWSVMLDINLHAVFRMMQLALPYLSKSRGNIINVSSVTGTRAFPGVLAYCVSKAAVDQLSRCAALELGAQGIRVNTVNPGVVVSNLHRRSGMSEEKYQAFLERSKTTHPLGRVGTPEDVANLIVFLASDKAGWITGGSHPVDGGRHQTCAR